MILVNFYLPQWPDDKTLSTFLSIIDYHYFQAENNIEVGNEQIELFERWKASWQYSGLVNILVMGHTVYKYWHRFLKDGL